MDYQADLISFLLIVASFSAMGFIDDFSRSLTTFSNFRKQARGE